jgi:tetratricopeptide (TPR) repeat protein
MTDDISPRSVFLESLKEGRQRLSSLADAEKLAAILELSKKAQLYSPKVAEELIDEGMESANRTATEDAVLLICEKAFWCFHNARVTDAASYADTALKGARQIGSESAEARALTIKGYIDDVKGGHKKASAWYTMALGKCSTVAMPGLLLDIGTSLSKQGEYAHALTAMSEAIALSQVLAEDTSSSEQEKLHQRNIHAETLSRLGAIYENIGDYDEASRVYDESIGIAERCGFGSVVYKACSRKTKLMLSLGRLDAAQKCLVKAENHVKEMEPEPRVRLFLANDWARIFGAAGLHEKALAKYREILYGGALDEGNDFIGYVTKYQADLFSEVIAGTIDALYRTGRVSLAEALADIKVQYSTIIRRFGIYEEFDKSREMEIVKNRLVILLDRVFEAKPMHLEYKGIEARYDPDRDKKAILIIRKTREVRIATSYFFILKCFVEHIGQPVTQRRIEEYLKEHGENIGGTGDSGTRTYVARLRKDYGFGDFIVRGPRGKGWKLVL